MQRGISAVARAEPEPAPGAPSELDHRVPCRLSSTSCVCA